MWLGLDSSTAVLSISVSDHGKKFETTHWETQRRLGEELFIHMQKFLNALGFSSRDLTAAAVGLGPGSFTGTRVGIAAVSSLAQGLGIPIAGCSSFEALASAVDAPRIAVISNAGRDQFYYAYYERDRKDLHTKLAPCLGTLEEICQKLPQRPCWLVGPEAEKIRTRIQSDSPALAEKLQALSKTPSAEDVLRVAAPAIEHGGMAWPEIQPLYIRRTQAEENQAGHQHG